jgi:hypothetical protein
MVLGRAIEVSRGFIHMQYILWIDTQLLQEESLCTLISLQVSAAAGANSGTEVKGDALFRWQK